MATPEVIFQYLGGYLASQALFVASEIGIFAALGSGPQSVEALAEQTGTPPRSTRIVADTMVALGLLEQCEGAYCNTAATGTFLSGRTPADLRPLLRLNHKIQYEALAHLEEAVRADQPTRATLSPAEQAIYSAGIEAFSAGTAMALAAAYDFSRHRRLLDLGGGSATFLQPIQRQYPDLEATLFERKGVAALAREQRNGHKRQIVEGDFFKDPLPGGHDAVLLANVVHNFPAPDNVTLLHKVRASVPSGARLLLVDLWTNEARTEPILGALLSGMWLVFSGGEVYSAQEGRGWLAETGWQEVGFHSLGGPMSLLIAEAVA